MKAKCYLVFNRRGIDRSTKGMPDLKGGEFAVHLTVEIPDAVFSPAVADVSFEIPPRAMLTPIVYVEGATKVQPDAINDETASGSETVNANNGNDL